MDEYRYQYPNNLEAPPLWFSWEFRDLVVIAVGFFISLIVFINLHSVFPGAMTVSYAVITMHYGDDSTLLKYLLNVINYIVSDREWEYRGGNPDFRKNTIFTNRPSKADEAMMANSDDANADFVAKSRKARKQQMKEIEDTMDGEPRRKKTASEFVAANLKYIVIGVLIAGSFLYIGLTTFLSTHDIIFNGIIPTIQEKDDSPINIQFSNTTELSWKKGSINALDYVVSANGNVTASPEYINTTELGPVTVVYTVVKDNGRSETFTREFMVVDNSKPTITFNNDTVTIKKDSAFKPEDNILDVSDDGGDKIVYAETAGFGKYTVTSDVDVKTPGTYKVTVDAIDANGNETTQSYTVIVE